MGNAGRADRGASGSSSGNAIGNRPTGPFASVAATIDAAAIAAQAALVLRLAGGAVRRTA